MGFSDPVHPVILSEMGGAEGSLEEGFLDRITGFYRIFFLILFIL